MNRRIDKEVKRKQYEIRIEVGKKEFKTLNWTPKKA